MFVKESKTFKLTFMSTSTWRKLFLIKYNELHKKKKKVVFDRSSTIPITFVNSAVHVYSGSKLKPRKVTRWMVGFKFGEFTWNRRLALYKAKQLRKKKKKMQAEMQKLEARQARMNRKQKK